MENYKMAIISGINDSSINKKEGQIEKIGGYTR